MTPIFVLLLSTAAALAGCNGQVELQGGSSSGPASSSSSSASSSSSSSSSSGEPLAEGEAVTVRLANLGPYFNALDLCVGHAQPDGAGFPSGLALAAAGRPQGVNNKEVSAYVAARTGSVIRVVNAGSSCDEAAALFPDIQVPASVLSSHLAPRFTVIPLVDSVETGNPTISTQWLAAFEDEPENPHYGTRVRALQVMSQFWKGDTSIVVDDVFGEPKVWYETLSYGAPATHSPLGEVSAAGFFGPWSGELGKLRVVQEGTILQTNASFSIPPGDGNAYGVASVFISAGGAYVLPSIIACADNAPPVNGLSACSIL